MDIKVIIESFVLRNSLKSESFMANFLILHQIETSIKMNNEEIFKKTISCIAHLTTRNINNALYRLLKNEEESVAYIIGNDDWINGEIILKKENENLVIVPIKYELREKKSLKKITCPLNETIQTAIISVERHKRFCNKLLTHFEGKEDTYSHFPSLREAYYYQMFPRAIPEKNQPFPEDKKKKVSTDTYMITPKQKTYFPWAPLEEAWEAYKEEHNIKDSPLVKEDLFSQDLRGQAYNSEKYSVKDVKTFLHKIGYETEELNFEGKETIHVVDTDVYIEKSERNVDENSIPKIRFDSYPINERHKSDRELFDKLKEKFAIKNDEEKLDGENYQKKGIWPFNKFF